MISGRRALVPWLLAAALFLAVAGSVAWLGAGTERELDLRTGRVRTARYVAWLPVSRKVEATEFSRALSDQDLRDAEPLWRALPGAEEEIGLAALTWKVGRLAPEARRLAAKDVLALWEEGGTVEASRGFTRELEALIESADGREITAKDVLEVWRSPRAARSRRPDR